jgi:hypothetical protein
MIARNTTRDPCGLTATRLGRVDKPDPDADATQQDEAEETAVGLFVAGGNTAKVLQLVNKALNAGA